MDMGAALSPSPRVQVAAQGLSPTAAIFTEESAGFQVGRWGSELSG